MGEVKDHVCYNGRVFADSSRTRMIPCPICQKQRKLQARDGVLDEETGKVVSLAEKLGINKKFVSDTYNPDYIIGSADIYYLDKNTLSEFNEQVDKLVSNLVMGVLPSYSMVMYLGRHARLQEFAFILLASAHKGVKTVGKLITARDIKMGKYDEDFKDHYTNDLEVVIATDDIDKHGVLEIQGFMKERAYREKPTIVLLSNRMRFTTILGMLCSLDSPRYDLGVYLGVNYKKNLKMSEESILIARKAIDVSNKTLGTSQELEERYKKPSKKVKSEEVDMQSIDLESLTSNGSFSGRY